MSTAIVLGGSRSVWEELEAARRLLPAPDLVVAVNSAGRDYPGHLDHWASRHPDKFPQWVKERRSKKNPPAGQLWTYVGRTASPSLEINHAPNWGGSSGLLGVTVALMHVDKVIICGIPLMPREAHYDRPKERIWDEASKYRIDWIMAQKMLAGRVKSMSGWTQKFLGAPTKDWLDD